ncbi:ferritin [Mangrovivirga cuniculi]|uniref:Ferritin n=1 Tax=Mangrovivirga cuniculi TaxID=2715131 RepID=A0A4D7JGU0_9BACT|nr:ferritin [Mangrovivirga cuniculi]QCK14811.1 ferritin [Mangrovivirga cuniculi]
MKDLIRLNTSLTEKVESQLNEQIRIEAASSSHYLAMASWCEVNGFENSAEYFYKQSDEERAHMLKIFKYVNDVGGHAVSPKITEIRQDYGSFKEIFEVALENEIAVSKSINNLVDICYKEKDHSTINFLQWFLEEQREEEYVARRCLELFDVIGEETQGRWMIDKQIPEITYREE